jgi:hypothetical protein
MVLFKLPLVARSVTVADPTVAILLAENVMVPAVEPVPIVRVFVVTPAGRPVAVIATVPLNPFKRVIEMAAVPVCPCWMERVFGVRLRVKSAAGAVLEVMVIGIAMVRVIEPLNARMLTVYEPGMTVRPTVIVKRAVFPIVLLTLNVPRALVGNRS